MSKEYQEFMKNHLGYSDEQMKTFLKNPKNLQVLKKAPELMNKTIVVEVIESQHCGSQHIVGQKFYFDSFANLLTKLCPKRICMGALGAVESYVHAASMFLYADQDPNEMVFTRVSCIDVGLECGGWGKIVMEVKVIDRKDV